MKYTTTVDAIRWEGDLNVASDFLRESKRACWTRGTDLLIEDADDFYLIVPIGDWLVFDGEFGVISDDHFKKNYV